MTPENSLTHINDKGQAHMVDVASRDITLRIASASGWVKLSPQVIGLLRGGGVPKGDVLATARIAAIMGAKRTPDLIPLCHPIAIHGVDVNLEVKDQGVFIEIEVRTADRTGVEMEALTAVSIALLTVYDMCKAVDKKMKISNIVLTEKTKSDINKLHYGV